MLHILFELLWRNFKICRFLEKFYLRGFKLLIDWMEIFLKPTFPHRHKPFKFGRLQKSHNSVKNTSLQHYTIQKSSSHPEWIWMNLNDPLYPFLISRTHYPYYFLPFSWNDLAFFNGLVNETGHWRINHLKRIPIFFSHFFYIIYWLHIFPTLHTQMCNFGHSSYYFLVKIHTILVQCKGFSQLC